jgi:hypothetical protein
MECDLREGEEEEDGEGGELGCVLVSHLEGLRGMGGVVGKMKERDVRLRGRWWAILWIWRVGGRAGGCRGR